MEFITWHAFCFLKNIKNNLWKAVMDHVRNFVRRYGASYYGSRVPDN